MTRIKPGMIVELSDGKRGVTVPDFMSCCAEWETPVVWEGGDSAFDGTTTELLKVIGPENPKADPNKCGAGLEAECCIFLTASQEGFCCERRTSMRYTLQLQKSNMSAKREPTEIFPKCQLQPQ